MASGFVKASGFGWVGLALVLAVPGFAVEKDVSIEARSVVVSGAKHAIIVGVGDYDVPRIRLQAAPRDASSFASFLQREDRTGGYKIHLLVDKMATRRAIARALEEVRAESGPNDTVLFFFSGHGMLDRSGVCYLCPVDVDPSTIQDTGYPLARVNEVLQQTHAKQKIMILDCCHSGVLGEQMFAAKGGLESGLSPDRLKKLTEGSGVAIMSSSEGSQLSWEDVGPGGSGMGYFTKYMLKGLEGEADHRWGKEGGGNQDGLISVSELYQYVYYHANDDVRARHNATQQAELTMHGTANLYLALAPPTAPVIPVGPAPVATPPVVVATPVPTPVVVVTPTPAPVLAERETATPVPTPTPAPAATPRPTVEDKPAADPLRAAAERGEADAQVKLGFQYATGKGQPKNPEEALRWFRKAAEQDDAQGQCSLGTMYAMGDGVEPDYAEAIKWLRKAGAAGEPQAQSNLGYMYQKGRGVEKDADTAATWYRKAASQGYAQAEFNLGGLYERGEGCEESSAEAMKWYRKAAAHGSELGKKAVARLQEKEAAARRAQREREREERARRLRQQASKGVSEEEEKPRRRTPRSESDGGSTDQHSADRDGGTGARGQADPSCEREPTRYLSPDVVRGRIVTGGEYQERGRRRHSGGRGFVRFLGALLRNRGGGGGGRW